MRAANASFCQQQNDEENMDYHGRVRVHILVFEKSNTYALICWARLMGWGEGGGGG